jgi:hypothetical protein
MAKHKDVVDGSSLLGDYHVLNERVCSAFSKMLSTLRMLKSSVTASDMPAKNTLLEYIDEAMAAANDTGYLT